MRPFLCAAGVMAVLVLAGLVSGPAGASSDEEIPSIKKVMTKLQQGQNVAAQHGEDRPQEQFAELDQGTRRGKGLSRLIRRRCPRMTPARRKRVV